MKLQPLLNEFLYTHGNLPLQGVGSLQVQELAAQEDGASQQLKAPTASIVFRENKDEPVNEKLIKFISHRLQVPAGQAQALLQDVGLQQAIAESGGDYSWPLAGKFSNASDGTLLFQPETFSHLYFPDIPLKPILTAAPEPVEPAENKELTAPSAADSAETPEWQDTTTTPQSRWWIGALLIFILSLLLIAYRYL